MRVCKSGGRGPRAKGNHAEHAIARLLRCADFVVAVFDLLVLTALVVIDNAIVWIVERAARRIKQRGRRP